MAPSHLLDTNSCIYLIGRTSFRLAARLESCAAGSVGISAIVSAELWKGFAAASEGQQQTFGRFLKLFPVVPFDDAAARAYAKVPFRRGKLDRLIAAHALALGATLITNNVRDFADVPGLKVENWTGA